VQRIITDRAPAPIGPYNQAVSAGGFLFCSGQIALDPSGGSVVGQDAEAKTRQVMHNVEAILAAAGTNFERVVKTTIFLVDMSDFAAVNAVYGEFVGATPPARSTVAVAALPRNARVEIEVIAQLDAA